MDELLWYLQARSDHERAATEHDHPASASGGVDPANCPRVCSRILAASPVTDPVATNASCRRRARRDNGSVVPPVVRRCVAYWIGKPSGDSGSAGGGAAARRSADRRRCVPELVQPYCVVRSSNGLRRLPPLPTAFAITATLLPPACLAVLRGPVTLAGMPPLPGTRLRLAGRTAIARLRTARPKELLTILQETAPRTRMTTGRPLNRPARGSKLGWVQGRCCSQGSSRAVEFQAPLRGALIQPPPSCHVPANLPLLTGETSTEKR